jgi:hypothetical protein
MNDGDVPLTDAHVHLYANGVEYAFSPMDVNSPYFVGGDDGDGIMDPGETWTWQVQVTVYESTLFVVTGCGFDPWGNPVDYPEYPTEYGEFTVDVGGATRTAGFWKTHLWFTNYVFENYLGGYICLGYKEVDSMSDLMGIMWANKAKESDRTQRSPLCKAKQKAAFQAIPAILNDGMPGGAPLPDSLTPGDIASILCGDDISAINDLATTLDEYNNLGDDQALDPSLPPTGKADPKGAKEVANIPFADGCETCMCVLASLTVNTGGEPEVTTLPEEDEVTTTPEGSGTATFKAREHRGNIHIDVEVIADDGEYKLKLLDTYVDSDGVLQSVSFQFTLYVVDGYCSKDFKLYATSGDHQISMAIMDDDAVIQEYETTITIP